MPTYEYRCGRCGDFELVQKITDDRIKTCPTCNQTVERLVSAAAFHLKGSGWYKTDYASSGSSSNNRAANGGSNGLGKKTPEKETPENSDSSSVAEKSEGSEAASSS